MGEAVSVKNIGAGWKDLGLKEKSLMHTKTISMLLGALLATGVVLAQAPDQSPQPNAAQATANQQAKPHHEFNPDRQADHLGKKLGLTGDQVAQIKPILEKRQQQMKSLHSDASLAPQDRHAKAQEIMLDSKNKIEAVLNDTQKQQFEQMLQERRAHHNSQPQAQ
jgi:Spy/CpxP family protein refolding chaperone